MSLGERPNHRRMVDQNGKLTLEMTPEETQGEGEDLGLAPLRGAGEKDHIEIGLSGPPMEL